MLLKILLVGVLVAGAMAAVKDGRILVRAGLLSSCSAVPSDPLLQRCSAGRLDGYPDLQKKACTSAFRRDGDEFWRCPAPIVASPAPRG